MNLEDVDARQGFLDERLERIPRSRKSDVGLVGQAATTCENGDNTALPVDDNRAGVAAVGEGTTPAVGDNGGLEGGEVDIAEVVVANKGFEPVHPAGGSACGHTILDHGHRGIALGVALRGLTDFALRCGADDLEQAVLGVLVVSPVGNVGIHEFAVGLLVDLAPCAIKYKYTT